MAPGEELRMSKRVYERDLKSYELKSILAMEDAGQARKVEGQDFWVVQLDEGGQVIVRPHQVFDPDWGMSLQDMADEQEAELYAENAWLRHAENAGWEDSEMERQIEAERGVIPFSDAYAMSQGEF